MGREGKKSTILIAEDDAVTRNMFTKLLTKEGHQLVTAGDGQEALELVSNEIAVAILDLRMPKVSGLECLRHFQTEAPFLKTIVTSSAGLTEAVTAMKAGAYWFLQKPFGRDELLALVTRAIEHHEIAVHNAELQRSFNLVSDKVTLTGKSYALKDMKKRALAFIKEDKPLVLVGERGTEKLDIGRYLHQRVKRKGKPFIVFHIGTRLRTAIDAELFGYEASETGTSAPSSIGKVELADQGTLYIEDIGELPIEFQEKLAAFIRTGVVTRIGSDKERNVSLKFIFGTEHDLDKLADEGVILPEFYELLSNRVTIPPLRKRRADIPEHVDARLRMIEKRDLIDSEISITDEAIEELMARPLHGNIPQLESIIECAVRQCEDATITVSDLTPLSTGWSFNTTEQGLSEPQTLEEIERKAIEATLNLTAGNQTEAARKLGISPKTMYNKIKKYGLQSKSR